MSEGAPADERTIVDEDATEKARSRFRRFFWGTFLLLFVVTATLEFFQALHPEAAVSQNDKDLSTEAVQRLFGQAGKEAEASARSLIVTLVNEAYDPVYRAVPVYAEHHYSLLGQYQELGATFLGDVGMRIEETLFDRLEDRLANASLQIDDNFRDAFEAELAAGLDGAQLADSALGDLTRAVVADTRERMVVTAPLATSGVLSTALSAKLASGTIAKSIVGKLTAKVAAKTGGKLAAAGSSASAGALVCSWSGPGAAVCGAGAGAVAWVLTDAALVNLDEYWNREEFEADLRQLINEAKRDHIAAFEHAMDRRIAASQQLWAENVQRYDFAVRELSGAGSAEVCAVAGELSTQYEALRESLRARTPARLAALRSLAAEQVDDFSIGRQARQVLYNLSGADELTIETVRVIGMLPREYVADRKVTLRLGLGGRMEEASQLDASSYDAFNALLTFDIVKKIDANIPLDLRIEQHLYFSNRYFAGTRELRIDEVLEQASNGLRPAIMLPISVSYDDDAASLDEATAGGPERSNISLRVTFSAAELLPLDGVPQCR